MKIKYSGILSPKAQRISNAVSVVANIAKHPIDFSIEDLKELDSTEFNSQEGIQYLLHEIKSEKPHFQNVIDSRIIRPSGAFCLYGIDGNKSIPASLDFGYKMNIINKVQKQTAVEDLINDCLVIFWENREFLAEDTVCEACFYTIVKNKCLDYLRDKQTHIKIQNQIHATSTRLLQYDLASLESYDPNLFSNEIRTILKINID